MECKFSRVMMCVSQMPYARGICIFYGNVWCNPVLQVPADIDTSGRYALRFDYTDSNGNEYVTAPLHNGIEMPRMLNSSHLPL